MRHYDFRETKMGQVWLVLIPILNVILLLIWNFTWLKGISEDFEDHSGKEIFSHYKKIRLGIILFLLGLVLIIVPLLGPFLMALGIVLYILGAIRFAKDFEDHLIEERSMDYWITKGNVFLGIMFPWHLQSILNAHWRGHGMS